MKKITKEALLKKAKALGVDNKNLTGNMGQQKTSYYELLLRVRNEQAYRMSQHSQIFAIIAVVAAVASAVAAIIAVYHGSHPPKIV